MTLLVSVGLAACGSSPDSNSGSAASAAAALVSSTQLSGQVVKGPVAGATVCAYAIVAGVRSTTPAGPCVTSDSAGNYTFAPISNLSGDMIIEASGGSYRDEVSNADQSLPNGTPLKVIVPAKDGQVQAFLTPLTTIAVNTAPSFSNQGFAQAAAIVSSQAGLTGVDLASVAPSFGPDKRTATNAYAAVLGGISQYMATANVGLSTALGNWKPENQSAFNAAISTYVSSFKIPSAATPSNASSAAGSGSTSTTPTPVVPATPGQIPGSTSGAIAPEFASVTIKLDPAIKVTFKGEWTTLKTTLTGISPSGLAYRYFLSLTPNATLSRFLSDTAPKGQDIEIPSDTVTLDTGTFPGSTARVGVEVYSITLGVRKKVAQTFADIPLRDVQDLTFTFTTPTATTSGYTYSTATSTWQAYTNSSTLFAPTVPILAGATSYVFKQFNNGPSRPTQVWRVLITDILAADHYSFAQSCTPQTSTDAFGNVSEACTFPAQSAIPVFDELSGRTYYNLLYKQGQNLLWQMKGLCSGMAASCTVTDEVNLFNSRFLESKAYF
jgi:hypothetical protein